MATFLAISLMVICQYVTVLYYHKKIGKVRKQYRALIESRHTSIVMPPWEEVCSALGIRSKYARSYEYAFRAYDYIYKTISVKCAKRMEEKNDAIS